MAIATTVSILVMILSIVIMVLLVLLQIFLSKKENKWVGLILPGIHLAISIVMIIYICMVNMAFVSYGDTVSTVAIQAEEVEILPNEEIDDVGVPGTDSNNDTVYYDENIHNYEAGTGDETEYLPDENVTTTTAGTSNLSFNIVYILLAFLCLNIPTIVDLIIYYICRKNVKKRSNVDKMRIQDL